MSDRTRIAWFHCFAGIAGDMALASLIDAGADIKEIITFLERLAITGWSIEAVPVLRCGLAATHLVVNADGDGVTRTFPVMRTLIEEAKLPPRVAQRSLKVLSALASAEATLHRQDLDTVHFHELAGYDTLLDVVGTAAALEVLDVERVYSSAIALGSGTIACAHGRLPNPAPAVGELLRGVPVVGHDIDIELTTPTGAALAVALSTGFGPIPAMTIEATGYGAGTKEIDGLANVTQVVIGTVGRTGTAPVGQPLVLIEANIDDATGEQIADAIGQLMDGGAADAWVTPILMKKGRPGHLVSALCDLALAEALRELLMIETGSLGVRSSIIDRWAASRSMASVVIDGFEVGLKVTSNRVKAEHDDAEHAARALGRPVREIIAEAERRYRAETGDLKA